MVCFTDFPGKSIWIGPSRGSIERRAALSAFLVTKTELQKPVHHMAEIH